MNRVRIIGGAWRSRVLRFPDSRELRPTPDRVRETLFNWLGQDLTGRSCLDLCSGSGALGFEAASRGASPVVMVERDRAVHAALEANRRLLDASAVELKLGDAVAFLKADRRTFDVVFLDPPFGADALPGLLAALPGHLAAEAVVYVETDWLPEFDAGWIVLRQGKAGKVRYALIQHSGEGSS